MTAPDLLQASTEHYLQNEFGIASEKLEFKDISETLVKVVVKHHTAKNLLPTIYQHFNRPALELSELLGDFYTETFHIDIKNTIARFTYVYQLNKPDELTIILQNFPRTWYNQAIAFGQSLYLTLQNFKCARQEVVS